MKYKRKKRKLFGIIRPHTNLKKISSGGRVGGGSFKTAPSISYTKKDRAVPILSTVLHKSHPGDTNITELINKAKNVTKTLKKYSSRNKAIVNTTNTTNVKHNLKRKPIRVPLKRLRVRQNVTASDVNREYKKDLNTKSKNDSSITENPGSGTNPDAPSIPRTIRNRQSKQQVLLNKGDSQHIEHTTYETGFRPSKANLILAKQHGVEVKTLTDSKIDFRTSLLRNSLTNGSGFNVRGFHIPCARAQLPWVDVRGSVLGSTVEARRVLSSDERQSASVLNLKQQFLIKNNSVPFPMEFKIHVVKLKKSAYDPNALAKMIEDVVPTPIELGANTNSVGKIPNWFMLGGLAQEAVASDLTVSSNFATSIKIRDLGISSNFRAMFDVCETFQKTIEPGDYWSFTHIHNCGSGIDLQLLSSFGTGGPGTSPAFGTDASIGLTPYTYGFIFESKGKMCEAFFVQDATNLDSYIGASPTFWSYEFKSTMNVVRDPSEPTLPFVRYSRLRPATLLAETAELGNEPTEIRLLRSALSPTSLTPGAGNIGRYFIPYETPTTFGTRALSSDVDAG